MNKSLLAGIVASMAARAAASLGEPIKVEIDGEEPITMTPEDFSAMAVMSLGEFITETVKTLPKALRHEAEVDMAAGVFGLAAGFTGHAVGMSETRKKKPKKGARK